MNEKLFELLKSSQKLREKLTQGEFFKVVPAPAPQGLEAPYITLQTRGAVTTSIEGEGVWDALTTQIDIWASTSDEAEELFCEVRKALARKGSISTFLVEKDATENLFRLTLDYNYTNFSGG